MYLYLNIGRLKHSDRDDLLCRNIYDFYLLNHVTVFTEKIFLLIKTNGHTQLINWP